MQTSGLASVIASEQKRSGVTVRKTSVVIVLFGFLTASLAEDIGNLLLAYSDLDSHDLTHLLGKILSSGCTQAGFGLLGCHGSSIVGTACESASAAVGTGHDLLKGDKLLILLDCKLLISYGKTEAKESTDTGNYQKCI